METAPNSICGKVKIGSPTYAKQEKESMKSLRMVLVLTVLLAMTVSSFAASAKSDVQWKSYSGAWFDVLYPADFQVIPSLKDQNNPASYASVIFSPLNREVEFYVFSPKFSMAPTDVELKSDLENLVSKTEKKRKTVITTTTTISAKDGSYVRVVEESIDTGMSNVNVRHAFGIKYQDQRVYEQYKKMFKKFQDSLVKKRE